MNFQKIVLIIAFIILIVTLVFMYYALKKATNTETWPPVIADCPDYWVDLSGNGAACFNSHNLGTCNLPSRASDLGPIIDKNLMNFNQSPYSDPTNGICSKYTWANNCGVTWDGITYGVPNPCSNDTST
jgi:hypothetical protein